VNAAAQARPFRADALVIDGERVYLRGSKCGHCGALAFPPRAVCAACRRTGQEPIPLGRTGRLYTFAVVRQAPKGFSTPYVIGYVDLDEGVRVFTRVLTGPDQDLRLGMPMSLTTIALEGGTGAEPVLAYAFRPAAHEDLHQTTGQTAKE
jgi:uncharacterized protein